MPKLQLTIHFTTEATARIAAETNDPTFKSRVFNDVQSAHFDGNFLAVSVLSREPSTDGVVQYYYNTATIVRVKSIDLQDGD